MLWLLQAAHDERQLRVVQLYRQTAKKEHANILRRRQIIEDRKEELEYINTQRVCYSNSLCHVSALSLSLSLIPGRGDEEAPILSRELHRRPNSGDPATTPAAPGHAPGSAAPDAPPYHQNHCNTDKWRSPDIRRGADRLPTTENGPHGAEPPWRTDLRPSRRTSSGEDAPAPYRQTPSGHVSAWQFILATSYIDITVC